MCRFLAYSGPAMRMADLLTESERSLIRQSYHARERAEPLNGDGFGIGWYLDDPGEEPCLYTSIHPAWSDRNLRRLAARLSSSLIFAHVRAATPGLVVSELNCHPFQSGRLLWMHNGHLSAFKSVKRRLRESLPDDLYNSIEGNSDTEHIFAVFQHQLGERRSGYTLRQLQDAMLATIEQLGRWTREAGVTEASYYNFALTDGEHILATRYVDDRRLQPETLYISKGRRFVVEDGRYHMQPASGRATALIIASEPLTDDPADWQPIPPNHMLAVDPVLETYLAPIP